MAIKRDKKKSAAPQLPEKLDALLLEGFTASVLEKKFKEDGSEVRKDIVAYLEENDDGFEIEISKSFKSEYGSVNMKQRENTSVDKDMLIDLVHKGKVTIETLINLGSFAGGKLTEAGLGAAVTLLDPTEFIELRASKEFKEKVDAEFSREDVSPSPIDLEKDLAPKKAPVKKAPAKKAAPKEDDARAKAKAAAEKIKAKTKPAPKVTTPEDDLDAILGE